MPRRLCAPAVIWSSGSRPVALLVFLPAPAGARVVAPDFRPAHHLLGAVRAIPAELQLLQLLLFLALDVAREVLDLALGSEALLVARLGTLGRLIAHLFLVLRLRIRPRRRSEEHTSELQSRENLVCRLLLEK